MGIKLKVSIPFSSTETLIEGLQKYYDIPREVAESLSRESLEKKETKFFLRGVFMPQEKGGEAVYGLLFHYMNEDTYGDCSTYVSTSEDGSVLATNFWEFDYFGFYSEK